MIGDKALDQTIGHIAEADTVELAGILLAAVQAHGNYGREVTENMLKQLKAEEREGDAYVREGLVQLCDLEGVLDGRLESL